jgi:hypothetical protein
MWHETHRELPARLVVKIGCTRVLKNSKSSDGGGVAGCCINSAAIGTKAKIGMTVSPFCPSVANERRDCISNQGNRGRRPSLEGVNELDESKYQQLALANPQFGTSLCISDNAECKRMFQIADWRVLIADPAEHELK